MTPQPQSNAPDAPPPPNAGQPRSILDWIEWAGNKLPEPALLFALLAGAVVVLSVIGAAAQWSVQPVQPRLIMTERLDADGKPVFDETGQAMKTPKRDADGGPMVELVPSGKPIQPRSLLTGDGIYWMLSSMLRNFTGLPALGLIFVAILGIGLAEKFGFFGAMMRALALATPRALLTPVIVFLGANASVASDAGYIILPPLAASLFHAVGRHPIAGVAAAFAGVSGGFGAGFFPTGGDGVLAGFAQDAARVIDPAYTVTIVHNIHFKSASAVVIMLAGWLVTDRLVEPRLRRMAANGADIQNGNVTADMSLAPAERRALRYSLLTLAGIIALFLLLVFIPSLPLHGAGQQTLADGRVLVQQPVTVSPPGTTSAPAAAVLARDPLLVADAPGRRGLVESPAERWSHVIVPIIFLSFVIPGIVYGRVIGVLKSQRDVVDALYHGIRSIVPVLAIMFFLGQFVNYLAYTRLDRMLAYAGGSLLVDADLPVMLLMVLFVLIVILGDFAISGMLSKFGVLAPIFIPMFMMVGMSPELTTAAYRIGDSVVNIITPMNSYLLIILAVLQKYNPKAGIGTQIALMLPYSIVFTIVWTGFLLVWYLAEMPLGPGAPTHYTPPH